ncbi:hypothetical protein [Ensifer sp. Root31]|uniref:hypothetical protein n=1 Tax=Ensifer sp. Root31 TaxID=1736512 RepID=UPI0012E9398E|nr:hypothetical protein [Ensifer sp. Root31]
MDRNGQIDFLQSGSHRPDTSIDIYVLGLTKDEIAPAIKASNTRRHALGRPAPFLLSEGE